MDYISLQSHMEFLNGTSQGFGGKCSQRFSKLIIWGKKKALWLEEFDMLLSSANSMFFSDHNHLLSLIDPREWGSETKQGKEAAQGV